jgi:hypothetical protein
MEIKFEFERPDSFRDIRLYLTPTKNSNQFSQKLGLPITTVSKIMIFQMNMILQTPETHWQTEWELHSHSSSVLIGNTKQGSTQTPEPRQQIAQISSTWKKSNRNRFFTVDYLPAGLGINTKYTLLQLWRSPVSVIELI